MGDAFVYDFQPYRLNVLLRQFDTVDRMGLGDGR